MPDMGGHTLGNVSQWPFNACFFVIVFVFVYLTGPQKLALNSHIGVSFPKDATPEMVPSFILP